MANLNAERVKLIRANLVKIIKETIRWKFEDGSSDGERETTYGASLTLGELIPDFNHGEGKLYPTQVFELEVNRYVNGKADHQSKAIDVTWEIEENITQDTLNVGDLAISRPVTQREIDININDADSDQLVVTALIKVTFEDLRT